MLKRVEDVIDLDFPEPRNVNYRGIYRHSGKMQEAFAYCGVRFFMGRVLTPEEIEDRRKRALSRSLI